MGALTPTFLHSLETRMEAIMSTEYQRLVQDLWWRLVATEKSSVTKIERIMWLLDTAMIRRLEAGSMEFEDLVAQYHEFEAEFAGAGFKLTREKMEDVYNGMPGGEALELAGAWSRQIGFQSAYWPQFDVARAIRDGELSTSLTYDGLPFFDDGHFVNGFDSEQGVFSNILDSTVLNAAGLGSAAPAMGGITLDVAFENLQRCFAYIAQIKMPNGRDPRKLKPAAIIVPPALTARAQQLTNAKIVAQAAASGGGGADVEAVIRNWNIGQPVQADELASAFGGSDSTFYIVATADGTNPGALVYVNREPLNVMFHGPVQSPELARMREFQWLTGGRNVVGYGHPFKLFKVKAS